MRTRAACQEARDALAEPYADAFTRARVAAHRSRCADCRAYAGRIQSTAEAVRAGAGPGLDDIARARVTARLALAIDELATHHSQRQRRAAGVVWSRVATAAGLAAATAAILTVYVHGRGRPTRAANSGAAAAPAVAAAAIAPRPELAPAAAAASAGFTPELVKGRLEVPGGAVVRAAVGRFTQLTIVGPAQLFVETVAPQVVLRLESGLLVGEYEHHPGGTLRVHSPGATTTVVGTVFAVQALADGKSRVAVRRGAVLVQGSAETVRLRAGWSWASGEPARPAIPTALEQPLNAQAAARAQASHEPPRHENQPHPVAPPPAPGQASTARPAPPTDQPTAHAPAAAPHELSTSTAPPHAQVAALTAAPHELSTSTAPPHSQVVPPEQSAPAVQAKQNGPDSAAAAAASPRPQSAAVAAAAPQPQAAAAATADSLYAEAESAMRAGDREAVRSHLREVIRRFPHDGLADAALYELARREHADGQLAQARADLDRLLSHAGEKELREPARYLRCRLELDAHRDAEALLCLASFRRDFPASPHDAEVLALLIGLYQLRDDCQCALPLLDEYTRRYPGGPLDARARRTRCGR